jgi:hypothetical protein
MKSNLKWIYLQLGGEKEVMNPEYKQIIDTGSRDEKMDLIANNKLSPEMIDYVIKIEEDNLISDLIYFQDLQFDQHLKLLEGDDYELLRDRMEMYLDEMTLPNEVADVLLENDEYSPARSVLISVYPLSQNQLRQFLEAEYDFYEIISVIESQSLSEELIRYILDEKVKAFISDQRSMSKIWSRLLYYLLYNQNLPDEIIHQIIGDREQIIDLINGQCLSKKWIVQILSDESLEEYHYELIRMQTFDDELIDYVFNMKQNSSLYSLVRLQKLSHEHILRGLNLGHQSITLGILENQEFSKSQQDELSLRYPEYEKLIRSKPDIHSSFRTLFNRRHLRDGRLEKKRSDIF